MNALTSRFSFVPFVLFFALLPISPAGAEGSIPPQLYSTERAGVLDLDEGVLKERFQSELERCQTARGEGHDLATCLLLEGMVKSFSGERESGLASFQEAIGILEGLNDPFGTALVLVAMAEAERQMRHTDEAIPIYREALAVSESLEGSAAPINIEIFGIFTRLAGMPGDFWRQFGPMAQVMRPVLVIMAEILVRDSFATLLLSEGQVEEAEAQLELALAKSRSFYGLMDAQVLDHLGQLQERKGKYPEAAELFRQALAATQRTGDVERRYGIFGRLAEVEVVRGRLDAGLDALESARSLAREQGSLAREALLLTDLIDFYYFQGDVSGARELVDEALATAEKSGDDWVIVQARFSAGMMALMTGAYEVAAGHLERASSRLDRMESWREEVALMKVSALLLLSEVYSRLGRPERMDEKAAAAHEIARQIEFSEGVAMSKLLEELGRVLSTEESSKASMSGVRRATSELRQALGKSETLRLRHLSGNLGSTFETGLALHDLVKGGSALPNQSAVTASAGSSQIWDLGGNLLAAAQEAQAGRFEEARRLFEEFHRDAQNLQQPEFEAQALAGIAALHWKAGEVELAVERAKEAIAVFEKMVGGVHVDDLLSTFSSDRQWLYRITVDFLASSGKVAEAFDMAERARARAFLHQLGNQRLNAFEQDPALLGRLDDLRRDILALERAHSAIDAVRQKREQYDELYIQAKLKYPEYAELVSVDPLNLATLQAEVLLPDTTLVAYYVSGNRILAWTVDQANVEMFSFPTTPEEKQEIICLADKLGHGQARGTRPLPAGCAGLDGLEEKYFTKLVAPLLPQLHYDRLILVPHGVLHYVPFVALRDPEGKRFLEMKTVSYTPSVSVLHFLTEKASPFDGRALVMGDPESEVGRLPWAGEEARAVAELLGTEPLIGADASESTIRKSAGKIDVLHLAAHGVYRPWVPLFSHIALGAGGGDDGLLEVEELFRAVDLQGVNLVTLSACQTALGERNEGDEIVSLMRAFFYAGSPAVVSTLWRVDDRATAFLMKVFYERLLAGASYAEALRTAQLETSLQSGWDDPYYWAAFTLAGDADGRWQVE